MIHNNLSTIMGARRVRIVDVARSTGLTANGLANIYHDKVAGIRYETLDKLCNYFQCGVEDLIRYEPDTEGGQ